MKYLVTLIFITYLLVPLQASNHIKQPKDGSLKSLSFFDLYAKWDVQEFKKKKDPTLTSSSLNKKFYFKNAFLVKYVPFIPKNMFYTLTHLSKHLKHTDSSKLTKTSQQTYQYRSANYEEGAILTADWLIELGYDARVIVGKYKNKNHAWVLLLNQNNEYILDTSFRRKVKHFPLAGTMPNYHPKYMYNNKYIWINTGSQLTVKYRDKKWEKSYQFIEK